MGYLHAGLGGREFLTEKQVAEKAAKKAAEKARDEARAKEIREWEDNLKSRGLITPGELGDLIKQNPEEALSYLKKIAVKSRVLANPDIYSDAGDRWIPIPRTAVELYKMQEVKYWSFLSYYDDYL